MMGGGTPVDVRWVMVMRMVIKMLMGTVVSDSDDYDDDSCEDLEQQRWGEYADVQRKEKAALLQRTFLWF